jgi:hypothetical protein
MYSATRSLLFTLTIVSAGLGLAACTPAEEAPAAAAQEAMPMDEGVLADELLADWESLKTLMVAVAEEMPEENYGFKPTDELRDFGEQVMHVAGAQLGLMGRLDSAATPPDLGEPADKAGFVQALSDSFDFGTEVLSGQTDASLQEKVDGGFLGESTRVRVVYRTMIHTWSEYGVQTVYLRLNDIVPPASQ